MNDGSNLLLHAVFIEVVDALLLLKRLLLKRLLLIGLALGVLFLLLLLLLLILLLPFPENLFGLCA